MIRNFPEVFAGVTNIDARSTVVIRCILSMENALQQLLTVNPQLRITHDASYHDMYYMNLADKRSEEHTSELQSRQYLVCRLLLEKNKTPVTLLPTSTSYFSTTWPLASPSPPYSSPSPSYYSSSLLHPLSSL